MITDVLPIDLCLTIYIFKVKKDFYLKKLMICNMKLIIIMGSNESKK